MLVLSFSDWSQKVKDMDQTGAIEHDPDINIWRTEQEIMEQKTLRL
jgi:hypothetical protein